MNWFAEIIPSGGTPLVECDFFSYLASYPDGNKPLPPTEAIDRAIGVGNEFLEKMKKEHPGKKLHFDLFYNEHVLTGKGDPDSTKAFLGMVWAYNPDSPKSVGTNLDFFWSLYSENLTPDIPFVGKVKKDLLAYIKR